MAKTSIRGYGGSAGSRHGSLSGASSTSKFNSKIKIPT